MSKKYIIFSQFIISLFLSSCSSVYLPTGANAPLFSKKSNVSISANYSTTGVEGQFAYAFTDYIGAFISTAYYKEGKYKRENHSQDDIFKKNNLTEFAIGYYKHFTNNSIVETFLGYGYGETEFFNSDNLFIWEKNFKKGKYNKFFIQSDFGTKKTPYKAVFH